jgi:hypothetical protein
MSEPETSRWKSPHLVIIMVLLLIQMGVVAVLAYARLGEPRSMPEPMQRLAVKVRNARAFTILVPSSWAQLCLAWDTWLGELQSRGPRLLQTEALLKPNDPLRKAIADFLVVSKDLRPESLVPEATVEKRLAVLAKEPPDAVLREMQLTSVRARVEEAAKQITDLVVQLENWPEWDRLRSLLKLMQDRGFTRAAAALQARLPPARGSAGYGRMDLVRTLKLLNDLSLDETGTLLLHYRWSEISRLAADMQASGDRIQGAMPDLVLSRLTDQPSLVEFADSLVGPLEEMKLHRVQFLDPQVDRERFLKESPLQSETAVVMAADILRWEQELARFSRSPTPAVRQ